MELSELMSGMRDTGWALESIPLKQRCLQLVHLIGVWMACIALIPLLALAPPLVERGEPRRHRLKWEGFKVMRTPLFKFVCNLISAIAFGYTLAVLQPGSPSVPYIFIWSGYLLYLEVGDIFEDALMWRADRLV